jgi:hypothetical protein
MGCQIQNGRRQHVNLQLWTEIVIFVRWSIYFLRSLSCQWLTWDTCFACWIKCMRWTGDSAQHSIQVDTAQNAVCEQWSRSIDEEKWGQSDGFLYCALISKVEFGNSPVTHSTPVHESHGIDLYVAHWIFLKISQLLYVCHRYWLTIVFQRNKVLLHSGWMVCTLSSPHLSLSLSLSLSQGPIWSSSCSDGCAVYDHKASPMSTICLTISY